MMHRKMTKAEVEAEAACADNEYKNRKEIERDAAKTLKKLISPDPEIAGAEAARQKAARARIDSALSATGSRPVTIRLESADVERAKEQAQRKGLRYQTYIKSLLHEALEREASSRKQRSGPRR